MNIDNRKRNELITKPRKQNMVYPKNANIVVWLKCTTDNVLIRNFKPKRGVGHKTIYLLRIGGCFSCESNTEVHHSKRFSRSRYPSSAVDVGNLNHQVVSLTATCISLTWLYTI